MRLHLGGTKRFSVLCRATCHCETSGCLSYLNCILESAHFSCQERLFQDWQILCVTQSNVCSVQCAVTHHSDSTSCPYPQCLLLKPPLRALGTHRQSSLQPIHHLCPLHAASFEDTPQPSDQVFCTCCKEISVLCGQLIFLWIYWNSLS